MDKNFKSRKIQYSTGNSFPKKVSDEKLKESIFCAYLFGLLYFELI